MEKLNSEGKKGFLHDQANLEREALEEQFYNNLEESDTLVDYFCIVGLDQLRIQQLLAEQNGNRDQMMEELSQLKPQLLCRFPPKNKKGLKIDEGVESEIPNFAFPSKYEILQSLEQPKSRGLSMMFDGGLQKIFAQFLIIYEDLEDYNQAFENFKTHAASSQLSEGKATNKRVGGSLPFTRDTTNISTQTRDSNAQMFDNLINDKDNGDQFQDIPKKNDQESELQKQGEEEKKNYESPERNGRDSLNQKRGQMYVDTVANGMNNQSGQQPLTPIIKGVATLMANSISQNVQVPHTPLVKQSSGGSTIFGSQPQASSNRLSSKIRKRIFIPKALCILSRYPFFDYFYEILEDLQTASKHHLINTIEAYVNKLVLECPAPPRGLAKVNYEQYSKRGKYLQFTQPPINELPYVNRSFFDILFKTLVVEDIIAIFTHLLVERSVLIVSPNVENLVPITQSLMNLIHPFEWTICIPFIKRDPNVERDQSNLFIVCQPWPYMIGILDQDLAEAQDLLLENNDKAQPLIIQLTKQKVKTSKLQNLQIQQFKTSNIVLDEGVAQRNHVKAKNIIIPQLPQKLYSNLLTKVKSIIKSENPNQMMSMEGINKIRNNFYAVLLELFAYYKEFVGKDVDQETTFDIKRFCQISNKQYREFYQQFFFNSSERQDRLSNQLFMNFISQQTVNTFNNIQCALIHFNESIQKHQDGEAFAPIRRPHPFLQDESQGFKEVVDSPCVQYSQFSLQELKDAYLMNPEKHKFFPIEINRDEDGNEGYRYLFFPVLNPLIYESPKIFHLDSLAANLENKLQKKYRTESKQAFRSLFQRQKINIPQVSRTEGTYVYITWIYMWCSTLWMQDEREKQFRLLQVLQVIAKLKAEYIQRPQLDLFFLLIETSYLYGNMKMTQKIYETLPKYDLKPDARIQQRYFQHLKISQKKQMMEKNYKKKALNNNTFKKSDIVMGKQKESIINDRDAKINQREQQYLNPDSRIYRQVKYQQQFRKRTFKTHVDSNIHFDEVRLKLQEECGYCQGQLLAAQLRKAIENLHTQSQRPNAKAIHALCTYCGREIQTPQIKVMIGKRLKNVKGSYKEENTIFISAMQLHKWLEILFFESEDMKIDVQTLREFNKQLFWNMIYYFNDYQLPFDFILPYEDTSEFDKEYEELKKTAQQVRVYQMKNDMDEVIEDERENDEEPK